MQTHLPSSAARGELAGRQDVVVRVLRIGNVALGVSAAQEAAWDVFVAEARRDTEEGLLAVPAVWFRTDRGAFGAIPVAEKAAVSFTDDEQPAGYLGAVISLGCDAKPSP